MILPLANLKTALLDTRSVTTYEPTGLQEDIIRHVGEGKFQIIVALHANDCGKTTAIINILKAIIWGGDEWFSWWPGYSLFKDKKWGLKTFRITATGEGLKDSGAIQDEIRNWWPRGQYKMDRGGKHGYYSQFSTSNGWRGDALTYDQDREQHESKKLSVIVSDEPPPAHLVGAMTSRFASDGFLWIIAATPLDCAVFLDTLDDLEEKGMKIKMLTGTAMENHIDKGKRNHKGTKAGLRTDEQIKAKIASCPPDEMEARIYGKPNVKSGKVYPGFNMGVHVKDFDLLSRDAKRWNCYMVMDPHETFYPACQWWAITPESCHVLYNEYPRFEDLNAYYDEVRKSIHCDKDPKTLAAIFKVLDMSNIGLKMFGRFIDPRFAAGTKNSWSKDTMGIISKYAEYGLDFMQPPFEDIRTQRITIQELMKYDTMQPVTMYNHPHWYIMPHCKNSIRCFDRSFYESGTESEAEKFKDFCDCARYFEAGLRGTGYQDIAGDEQKEKERSKWVDDKEEMGKNLRRSKLG